MREESCSLSLLIELINFSPETCPALFCISPRLVLASANNRELAVDAGKSKNYVASVLFARV